MRGCSVLTRPSRISGEPVTAETGVTATPRCSRWRSVPPVERISKPSSTRPRASASTPDLSDTEMSARRRSWGTIGTIGADADWASTPGWLIENFPPMKWR